jgi:hypothetical protein
MVNHGLSTGLLFIVVGMVYERTHTREISELGGLSKQIQSLLIGIRRRRHFAATHGGLDGELRRLLRCQGIATAWVNAGAGSKTGGGISNNNGGSTQPRLASGNSTMYLAWIDDRTVSG